MTTNKLTYIISAVYILVVSLFMLWHRAWISADQFFAIAIIVALLLGRLRSFIVDWIPILLLYLSYEYLRGIAPLLNNAVHIWPMIQVDTFLFGTVPSITLQHLLHSQNSLQWYDFLFVICYMLHFIAPMIAGFYLWVTDRKIFKQYSFSFIVLSYAGFITYIIFPAMPPWMASIKGYIPPLQNITTIVMANFAQPLHMPSVYKFIKSNEVAAMPSLHAAYPLLIFLFMYKKIGNKALFLLPYVFSVWIGVIYLGEHYFIDVFMGVVYAVFTFILVTQYKLIGQLLKLLKQKLILSLPFVTNPATLNNDID